jgi:hypothetical protein
LKAMRIINPEIQIHEDHVPGEYLGWGFTNITDQCDVILEMLAMSDERRGHLSDKAVPRRMTEQTTADENWMPVIALIYFLPSIIAGIRSAFWGMQMSYPWWRSVESIFFCNIFAGWTCVGWFLAFIWACSRQEPTREEIQKWNRGEHGPRHL